MKYYTKDENALELALAVEKLYDKDDLPAINRIKKKIDDLENITSRLNELEAKSNMWGEVLWDILRNFKGSL